MALADIETRIIREAEQEAEKIVAIATQENEQRLKNLIMQNSKTLADFKQKNKIFVEQNIEQQRQLITLEAAKKILTRKREYLEQLVAEVEKEIIQNEKKLLSFYHKVLEENKIEKEQLTALKNDPDWPRGRLKINLGNSKINCSLNLYIKEQIRQIEAKLAAELF